METFCFAFSVLFSVKVSEYFYNTEREYGYATDPWMHTLNTSRSESIRSKTTNLGKRSHILTVYSKTPPAAKPCKYPA